MTRELKHFKQFKALVDVHFVAWSPWDQTNFAKDVAEMTFLWLLEDAWDA